MKRKYTWSKVYGPVDPGRERIREIRFTPPALVPCICILQCRGKESLPPGSFCLVEKPLERLPERTIDTIHAVARADVPHGQTRCGKLLKPKTDVSTTRRGIFYSTDPSKVSCRLCLATL